MARLRMAQRQRENPSAMFMATCCTLIVFFSSAFSFNSNLKVMLQNYLICHEKAAFAGSTLRDMLGPASGVACCR